MSSASQTRAAGDPGTISDTGAARYDCIIIGAGHNGLVCAAYLARGGRSVLVLEAAEHVGGAAVTREFAPGFRVSACAHLLYQMPQRLVRELDLGACGLRMAALGLPTVALDPAGAPLEMPAAFSADASGAALDGVVSPADLAALRGYQAQLARLAGALARVLEAVPPRLGSNSWQDRLGLARLGWGLRRLGRRDLRELLRIGGMCVQDLLDERFASARLKGALGFDAVLGTNFGPRSPGTAFTLLYRLAAAAAGGGVLAQPAGGLGALSAALARAAQRAGARIRTGATVERILVHEDRATGVLLASGERIEARTVVSSADPHTTFLGLLGSEHLDTGFVRRVDHLRSHGLTAKLHLGLGRLPSFAGLSRPALNGRLLLAPSLEYLERAFNHAKYGEHSTAPTIEAVIPTLADPALAPAGKHVLSAIVQYAPYRLAGGWSAEARASFTRATLQALEACAPDLASCIEAAELLTPVDIEREYRIRGGHWHHTELALDQFFFVRPVAGVAQYRAPLEGLFLCGAGCHPGGGVMGIAGRNAARQVLEAA